MALNLDHNKVDIGTRDALLRLGASRQSVRGAARRAAPSPYVSHQLSITLCFVPSKLKARHS